ncbi:MAG: hypothetical protein H6857_02535 [Rhodospirillales bacterium]|nr:hypothetical protein [Rhodospirillales bacterium]
MTKTIPKSNKKAPEGQQAIQSMVRAFERETGEAPTIWQIGNHLAQDLELGCVAPQMCRDLNGEFLGAVGKDKEGTVVVIDPRGIAAYRDGMCGYDVLGTAAAQDLIDGSGANGKVTYKPQESQARLMLDC